MIVRLLGLITLAQSLAEDYRNQQEDMHDDE